MANAGVKPKPSDYVHLHNHTHYSLLDGLTKVPALMERVAELGMDAIAMTDHGLMSGAVEFYKAAKENNLKPIIGMEAYVAPRSHKDKDPAYDRAAYHLTMLVMNNTGYRNLMRLSSIANLQGFYYRPRVDRDKLKKYNEGIIVLSGCMQGEVSDALRSGQYEQAKKIAGWYKGVFGDRYYLELQDHGHAEHPNVWDEQAKVNRELLKLSQELGVPAVVTCDSHYLLSEDQEAHEVLLCIQTGAFLEDTDRMSLKDFQLHVADPKEIIKRWGKLHPELILNTREIAERCIVELKLGEILIPKFPTPKGESERSLLEKEVWRGLAWRYGNVPRTRTAKLSITEAKKYLTSQVIDRTKYELEVVSSMGFNGYFLIVADFINWGKDRGIVFGPGRGSAASSIMAYGLRITEIDPLKYDLLFERFLNPDRISMPDMDIDIQDNRRDEVINYCIEKYGRDRVANIVTFGQMAARNSVRDVARVLRMPYAEADRLAKMIPAPVQGRHTPLATHLKQVPDLKREYADNEKARQVFDLAMRLEGTIRSHGVHAAGVVIAPDEIVNYVPLEVAQSGAIATQYSMFPIEDLGLLKMDFLGLSNLTIIKNTLRIVRKVYGNSIDISQIPLDDGKTFKMLQKGETTGVFQLESAGMKRYLKQLQPTVFEDIIAMVALYRPGPMQWIDDFIARKHGLRNIEYLHPVMKSALENTYGVIVYQEQVMQISKEMSGFSGGQADTMRKAIGKKNPIVMAKLKKDFIEGAVKTVGAERKLMERFWRQLEEFAAYCFNKVHSACYGLIAYQTAYLKAHYPAAFMAALMTSDYDNIDRLAIEITECKHMRIKVLPPDVNESFHEFAVVPGKEQIRFGLDAIKNVGYGAVEEILLAREKLGGKFDSIEDFCKNVNVHIVNRKALESLIKAGAFDSLGDRSRLLNNVENILSLAQRLQKETLSGQVDLFGGGSKDASTSLKMRWDEETVPYSQNIQLSWERELLGLYLSRHPLEEYEAVLSSQTAPIGTLSAEMDGRNVTIGGSITASREITTKNGSKMAFVKIADLTAEIELVVFPKLYESKTDLWIRDNVVLVKGRLTTRDRDNSATDEWKVIVEEARILTPEDAGGNGPVADGDLKQRLFIRLQNSSDQPLLMNLKDKLDSYRGETEVVIVTGNPETKQAIKLPQTISVNEESLRALAAIFGSTNIVVK
ncbi:DNA polymerase III subunit alpha [Candidatus Saccharibacteria bacterium]|nr:DNA polymerase III subunit alpha [Candidatus Saccharibacteria bacterium]